MRAKNIMTTPVKTVKEDTPIEEVARLMAGERISGVPVVDADGRMQGIVSETDLIHRVETGTERKRKWWVAMFIDTDMRARDFLKAHGRTAGDVMSRFVISVQAEAPLAEVANILDRNNLKRVPVLEEGKLIGIVTRGDIVRALASAETGGKSSKLDSATLQKELNRRMEQQTWLNTAYINAIVGDNDVELWGYVSSEDQHRALLTLVKEVAGGRMIEDNISVGRRPETTLY